LLLLAFLFLSADSDIKNLNEIKQKRKIKMELKKTKKKFFLMKKLLKQEMNFFLHKIIKKSIDFCTQPGVGEIFPD